MGCFLFLSLFNYINDIYFYQSATKNNDEQTIIGAAERARNLFSVLDSDGNGVLTLEEFIAGNLSRKKFRITNI